MALPTKLLIFQKADSKKLNIFDLLKITFYFSFIFYCSNGYSDFTYLKDENLINNNIFERMEYIEYFRKNHSEERKIEFVKNRLLKLPPWWELEESEQEMRDAAMRGYFEISHFETSIIRKGINEFIKLLAPTDSEMYYEFQLELSKLYALNRFLFNVPEKKKIEDLSDNEFLWANPYDEKNKYVYILHPLAIDSCGRLVFTGTHGMSKRYFNAISEFDYYEEVYGRRNIKNIKLSIRPFSRDCSQ